MSPTSPAGTPAQRCQAQDCATDVAADVFMCPQHWSMVPPALRDSITQTTPATGHIDASLSPEYSAYVRAAIAEVAHKEKRQRGQKTRTAKKPVQLALF